MGGGGERLKATLFRTHVSTHMHTGTHTPPQHCACVPMYTNRRPSPASGKLSLSPVYFPFPLLFVIVLMWELGRGPGSDGFWVAIPREECLCFWLPNPWEVGQEGGGNVSVCRYSSAQGELFQGGEAKKDHPVWREKGVEEEPVHSFKQEVDSVSLNVGDGGQGGGQRRWERHGQDEGRKVSRVTLPSRQSKHLADKSEVTLTPEGQRAERKERSPGGTQREQKSHDQSRDEVGAHPQWRQRSLHWRKTGE